MSRVNESDSNIDARVAPADVDMADILAAVDMPKIGLQSWFEHLDEYCRSHGGKRYYGTLMRLFDECRDTLNSEGSHAYQRTRVTRR